MAKPNYQYEKRSKELAKKKKKEEKLKRKQENAARGIVPDEYGNYPEPTEEVDGETVGEGSAPAEPQA